MDWIEKAYREHYGIRDGVRLSPGVEQLLDSFRAAEPKGVRMWTAVEWRTCDAPVFHRIAHRVLIPVEVREVSHCGPTSLVPPEREVKILTDPKTYTEEEVRVERWKAWNEGRNADNNDINPHFAPSLDPRALAAAKEWYPETPRGTYDKERRDLARIIAKHYEEKK